MEGNNNAPNAVPSFIDNRHNIYIPIPLSCCVTIQVRLLGRFGSCTVPSSSFLCQPSLLVTVLTTLHEDVTNCLRILPPSVHPLIRRTRIWVNGDDEYRMGDRHRPQTLRHMTTHHYEGWLDWARDRRDKALGIEIYDAREFLRMRRHWNGAGGLLLHEYCHLIHQHVFGLDDLRIQRLYAVAVASKRYECVPRRDWSDRSQSTDMGYCLVDHKEFFAELSVTYWSRGYVELDAADRDDILACSPPLLLDDLPVPSTTPCTPLLGAADHAAVAAVVAARTTVTTHCNKFYPFTSGQFRYCDPAMFEEFAALWQMIADWTDPFTTSTERRDKSCCCCPRAIMFWTGFSRRSSSSSSFLSSPISDPIRLPDPVTVGFPPLHSSMNHYHPIPDTVDL